MEQRTGLLVANDKKREMMQKRAGEEEGLHSVCLVHRKNAKITGVEDVLAFDENLVLLLTDLGRLKIEGSELKVKKLDMESGELELEGLVTSLLYQDKGNFRKHQESFWKRLLQ